MKLIRIFLSLVLLNSLIAARGQSIRVFDSKDKRSISYATVRSIDYKNGTYSDTNGVIALSNNFKDTLIISCVGYKTQIIKRADIRDNTIFLERQVDYLPSVTIVPLKFSREVILGILGVRKSTIWTSAGFGDEFAQKITFPDSSKKYKIKIIRIGVERFEPDIPVVLHVYNVAPNGNPMNDLLPAAILVKKENFNKRKQIVEINVSDKNIIIEDPFCFIGFEWLPVSGRRLPTTAIILTEDLTEPLTYARAFFFNKNRWTFAPSYRNQARPFNMVISVTADEYK